MIIITTRLILMALLCWWLTKEHKFKQNQQALDSDGADFMSSMAVVERYSYVHQEKFPTS